MVLRCSFLSSFLVLLCFASVASAASAALFCKCICATNSTIIPLNGDRSSEAAQSGGSTFNFFFTREVTNAKDRTCSDCNRQFCLDYNLPACKGVEPEQIITNCFQRDSAKDQLVVYTFILLTVGLLLYAAFQPWLEKWSGLVRERTAYVPVSSQSER